MIFCRCMYLLPSMRIKSGFCHQGCSPFRVIWFSFVQPECTGRMQCFAYVCQLSLLFMLRGLLKESYLHEMRFSWRWALGLFFIQHGVSYSLRFGAICCHHLRRRRWRLEIPPKDYLIRFCQNRRRHIRPMNVQIAFTPNSQAYPSAILILSTAGNWKVRIRNRSQLTLSAPGKRMGEYTYSSIHSYAAVNDHIQAPAVLHPAKNPLCAQT